MASCLWNPCLVNIDWLSIGWTSQQDTQTFWRKEIFATRQVICRKTLATYCTCNYEDCFCLPITSVRLKFHRASRFTLLFPLTVIMLTTDAIYRKKSQNNGYFRWWTFNFALYINFKEKETKKKRGIWCHEHFELRAIRGESRRTFRSLLDSLDEGLFSYKDDIWHIQRTSLVLALLQLVNANWRQLITDEEQLPAVGRIFPNLLSLFFIFVIPVDGIPQQYVIPHHLCNIFLIIIHPSQFTYRQKLNKHTFPIHSSSHVRREVVWDLFKKIPLTIFQFMWEAWSVMCEALWNFSLMSEPDGG